MLIYGKKDFTTPPPKKKDREEWQKYATVFFKKYEKSVHYPTWSLDLSLNLIKIYLIF